MARALWDGFDMYNGIAAEVGLATKWTIYEAIGVRTSMVAGRFGGQAARINNTSVADVTELTRSLGFTGTDFAVGFSWLQNLTGFGEALVRIRDSDGSTNHLDLYVRADFGLDLRRAGTLLAATVPNVFMPSVHRHFCIRGKIHDSTGECHVHLDGDPTPVISVTNVDTRNGGNGLTGSFVMRQGNFTYGIFDLDDWVTDNTNVQIPDRRVQTLRVIGDGATTDFVPSTGSDNYAMLDETTVSSADYTSGTNVGDLDLLTLGNLASTPDVIDGVSVVGFLRKTDSTTRAMALGVKSGATSHDGADHYLAATATRYETYRLTDPNTGVAFTGAGVDALELQPKITV